MRVGRNRNKITIEETTETQDSIGEPVDSWDTFARPWAEIEPRGGREYFDAQTVNAKIDLIFKIRYQSGIIPKMRISWNSRVFNILSVINVREMNKDILLACEEIV